MPPVLWSSPSHLGGGEGLGDPPGLVLLGLEADLGVHLDPLELGEVRVEQVEALERVVVTVEVHPRVGRVVVRLVERAELQHGKTGQAGGDDVTPDAVNGDAEAMIMLLLGQGAG